MPIIKWLNTLLCSILALLLIFVGCSSVNRRSSDVNQPSAEDNSISEVPIKVGVSDMILGPGDEIEILVWRNSDFNRTIKIIPPGSYYYPLIGEIQTMGVGVFQLRKEITEKLSKYIKVPQVSITIKSVESRKLVVLGEVNNPGIFPADSSPTVLQAITAAGGVNADAKLNSILLARGGTDKPELRKLNLEVALKEGDFRDNITLQTGDMLYVPTASIANVERFFRRIQTIIGPFVDIEKVSYYERLLLQKGSNSSGLTSR